jgi:hypothetical protein
VVTADALQTHADAAVFLVTGKQAHDLFVVKANQPTLLGRCARLAWQRVPILDRTRDRAHGRVELRTLKAVTVHHFGLPHAAQAHGRRRWCSPATPWRHRPPLVS